MSPHSNVILSDDLILPILTYLTANEVQTIDPAIFACSLVSRLWHNEALPLIFTNSKVKVVAREPDRNSLSGLHRFLQCATANPKIAEYVRMIEIRVEEPSTGAPANAVAAINFRRLLDGSLTELAQLVVNVESLSIFGDNWASDLRPESRKAIRLMCYRPSLRQFHDNGMNIPFSVWIHNQNITSVHLEEVRSDPTSINLEAVESPAPSGHLTSLTHLGVGGSTALTTLQEFLGTYSRSLGKLTSLKVDTTELRDHSTELQVVTNFISVVGNSLVKLDLLGPELIRTSVSLVTMCIESHPL